MDTENFSCIDLFAGCGGFSLGLRQSGWDGLFAIERDPMAFSTLSRNFLGPSAPYAGFHAWPKWLPKTNHDIATLLEDRSNRERFRSLRGSVTLVAGGPPCQGFSVGGRRDGADKRNGLVFRMLDMVDLVRPKVVLIENVEGIARRFVAKPGAAALSIADQAMERLGHLGYVTASHVLKANRFGVPQGRKRVVIIGVSNCRWDSGALRDIFAMALRQSALEVRTCWGLHPGRDTTAREALHDLHGGLPAPCPDSVKFGSAAYSDAKSAYAKAMRRGRKTGEVPDSHRFSNHGARVRALCELAHATQSPGRLSKAFLLGNGTKKDKKVLIDPETIVSTVTTHPDEFIHPVEPRHITIREMARLQSFPDDFHFLGRYTINGPRRKLDVAKCSQVGNAVPPLMAQGIGLAVRKMLSLLETEAFAADGKGR